MARTWRVSALVVAVLGLAVSLELTAISDLTIAGIEVDGSVIAVEAVNMGESTISGDFILRAGLTYASDWIPESCAVFALLPVGVQAFPPGLHREFTLDLGQRWITSALEEKRHVLTHRLKNVWTDYVDPDPFCDLIGVSLHAEGVSSNTAYLPFLEELDLVIALENASARIDIGDGSFDAVLQGTVVVRIDPCEQVAALTELEFNIARSGGEGETRGELSVTLTEESTGVRIPMVDSTLPIPLTTETWGCEGSSGRRAVLAGLLELDLGGIPGSRTLGETTHEARVGLRLSGPVDGSGVLVVDVPLTAGAMTAWKSGTFVVGEATYGLPRNYTGVREFCIRKRPDQLLQDLTLIHTTADWSNAGTNEGFALTVRLKDGRSHRYRIPDHPHNERERSRGEAYAIPLPWMNEYERSGDADDAVLVSDIEAVELEILGNDAWLPASLHLIASYLEVETFPSGNWSETRASRLLTSIRRWYAEESLGGWFSTDAKEGEASHQIFPHDVSRVFAQDLATEASWYLEALGVIHTTGWDRYDGSSDDFDLIVDWTDGTSTSIEFASASLVGGKLPARRRGKTDEFWFNYYEDWRTDDGGFRRIEEIEKLTMRKHGSDIWCAADVWVLAQDWEMNVRVLRLPRDLCFVPTEARWGWVGDFPDLQIYPLPEYYFDLRCTGDRGWETQCKSELECRRLEDQ